jgi:hypothetical protein
MASMANVDVIISIERDYHDRLDEVAQRLRAKGMEVGNELSMLHAITGSVDERQLPAVKQVMGVREVSLARRLHAI